MNNNDDNKNFLSFEDTNAKGPGKIAPNSTQRITNLKNQLSYKRANQKYRLDGKIARGGMGIVNRVFDSELHRHLAMKVLLAPEGIEGAELDKVTKLFLEESQLTAQLEHPNIVPVHDLGVWEDGNIYFTMKIVQGRDLLRVINKIKRDPEYGKQYSLHRLLTIFRKICDAVSFSHSRGVIHRDIKPSNVMIGHFGEVILMDWGLAKFIGVDIPAQTQETIAKIYSQRIYEDFYKTENGTIQGTPLYMSPEQGAGDISQVDEKSDIYLLGATLYHMVTLYPPHTGKMTKELLENIKKGNIIPAHERNIGRQISKELSQIISKAMALKKENRYNSVAEIASDVDSLMSGHIVSKPRFVKAGDLLIGEGEKGKEGYVVLKGKLEVYQKVGNKSVLLTTLGAGDIVGEMALITSDERSADVVVSEDAEVLVIDEEQIQNVLKRVPPWMEKLIVKLVERLKSTNNKIHPLLLDDPVYHVLKQLAVLCTFQVYQHKISKVEELKVYKKGICKEIANMLCIPEKTVDEILERVIVTELCERFDKDSFRFRDFTLFSHVLDFLHKLFEVDSFKSSTDSLFIDEDTKILRCKLAARISGKAKRLLSNVPFYAKMLEENN